MPSGIFIGQCVAVVCRVLSKRLQSSWTAACSHARCRIPQEPVFLQITPGTFLRWILRFLMFFAVIPGRQAAAEAPKYPYSPYGEYGPEEVK